MKIILNKFSLKFEVYIYFVLVVCYKIASLLLNYIHIYKNMKKIINVPLSLLHLIVFSFDDILKYPRKNQCVLDLVIHLKITLSKLFFAHEFERGE